jgi:hypothetical protein
VQQRRSPRQQAGVSLGQDVQGVQAPAVGPGQGAAEAAASTIVQQDPALVVADESGTASVGVWLDGGRAGVVSYQRLELQRQQLGTYFFAPLRSP